MWTRTSPSIVSIKRGNAAAAIAVVALALIWGYNWVVIKIATHDADPFSVTAIRAALGALCLFAALAFTRRPLRSPPVVPTIVLGLLQTTTFTLFQVIAVASGGAGKTSVLVYTMPFWAALLALPLLGERIKPSGWFSLALAAVGLVLVLVPFTFGGGLLSEAFALLSAISWAASVVYAKHVRARYTTELLSLTTWQIVYGAIPLVLVAMLVPHHVHLTLSFIAAMAYVAVPATALAWLLWMFILSRMSAANAGISSLLTPVIGVAAAWAQLGERPGPIELSGIACILAALVVNSLPARRRSA